LLTDFDLLAGHCDVDEVVGVDEVVMAIVTGFEFEPLDGAGKPVVATGVVVGDGGEAVAPHVSVGAAEADRLGVLERPRPVGTIGTP
jgi:hypothetical protein